MGKLLGEYRFYSLLISLLSKFPNVALVHESANYIRRTSHLARAAQTVRRHMFEEGEPFDGFPEGCQEDYVPSLLLALVSMVLEGPSIKDQMADTTPAAPAIAQMLKFNCIKHNREHPTT